MYLLHYIIEMSKYANYICVCLSVCLASSRSPVFHLMFVAGLFD